MASQDERRKVLDMLAGGQISTEQAAELLSALDEGRGAEAVLQPARRRGTAKALRISIDDPGDPDKPKDKPTKVRVNVPLGLAKFAARFIPRDAKAEMEGQGIDIQELLAAISSDPPEGPLVDIDVEEGEAGARQIKILIEVV